MAQKHENLPSIRGGFSIKSTSLASGKKRALSVVSENAPLDYHENSGYVKSLCLDSNNILELQDELTWHLFTVFDEVRYTLRHHHGSYISVRPYAIRHY